MEVERRDVGPGLQRPGILELPGGRGVVSVEVGDQVVWRAVVRGRAVRHEAGGDVGVRPLVTAEHVRDDSFVQALEEKATASARTKTSHEISPKEKNQIVAPKYCRYRA